MDTPYLLTDKAADHCLRSRQKDFYLRSLKEFGYFAKWVCELENEVTKEHRHLKIHKEIAKNILLLPETQRRPYEDSFIEKLDSPLFSVENSFTYKDLSRTSVAAALFPLDGDPPTLGRVWVFANNEALNEKMGAWQLPDHGGLLDKAKAGGYGIFLESPEIDGVTVQIYGPSWQLAAWLAMMALENSDQETILNLAADWIVTGQVDGYKIKNVEIGNKHDSMTGRKWIIPYDNEPTFSSKVNQRGSLLDTIFRAPKTVSGAYQLICDAGLRYEQPQKAPDKIPVLAMFIDNDSCVCPDVLMQKAEAVLIYGINLDAPTLNNIKRRFPNPVIKIATNNTIEECSKIIRQLRHQNQGKPLWVDITNLPWPQQMAVEVEARHQNVKLLWRDPSGRSVKQYWYDNCLPYIADIKDAVIGVS